MSYSTLIPRIRNRCARESATFLSDFTWRRVHDWPVKKRPARGAAVLLASVALLLTPVAPASAKDARPTPAASVNVDSPAFKALLKDAIAAWTASGKLYKSAVANRAATLKAINETFARAVTRAKADYDGSQSRMAAPSLQNNAAARYKDTLEKAVAIRQAAIDGLPELPPVPGPKPTVKSLLKSSTAASGTVN